MRDKISNTFQQISETNFLIPFNKFCNPFLKKLFLVKSHEARIKFD